MSDLKYPVLVTPIKDNRGGSYLASVTNLPGCMSDGETPEETIEIVRDAIQCWIDAARRLGREIPQPSDRQSDTRLFA